MGPHEPWVTIDVDSGSHCLFFLNRTESEMVERRFMSNSSIVIPHRLAFLNMAFIWSLNSGTLKIWGYALEFLPKYHRSQNMLGVILPPWSF